MWRSVTVESQVFETTCVGPICAYLRALWGPSRHCRMDASVPGHCTAYGPTRPTRRLFAHLRSPVLRLKGRGAIGAVPKQLQSGHRGCESGRLLAVGNGVGAGVGVWECLWGCIRGGGEGWLGPPLLLGSPYGPRQRWAENFEA